MGCDANHNFSSSAGNFKIYLVRQESPIPSYKPYEDRSWQDFVQKTKPEEIFITDQDVTSYDWNSQTFTLSTTATERIKERYHQDFQGQKYLDVSMHRFIVTLDEKPLYGGMFLFPASQIAADYPLIYLSSDQYDSVGPTIPLEKIDILKLSIYSTNLEPYKAEKMERIKTTSIKDFFASEGKLMNSPDPTPAIFDSEQEKTIQLIKDQYPQFKNFPQSAFAGGAIRAKKTSDIWSVIFITYGSGLPIIGTDCFMVENNKITKIENFSDKTENEAITHIQDACAQLLEEEKKRFSIGQEEQLGGPAYKSETGGPSWDRTSDLLLKREPLYQLSYWPIKNA